MASGLARRVLVAAWVGLLATAARGEPAPPLHPFAASVRLEGASARASYRHPAPGFGAKPANPPSESPTGHQAARAYAALLGVRFLPADGAPELTLEVSVVAAELGLDDAGWRADVTHLVVLRDRTGAELGRWRPRGGARIEGPSAAAIPRAFGRAAQAAAAALGRLMDVDEGDWRSWQVARGVPEAALAARSDEARRAEAALHPVVPPPEPRAARAWFAELGLGAVTVGEALSRAPAIRGGWTGERLLLAASLRGWSTTFLASPPGAWGSDRGSLEVLNLGLEAGWPVQITAAWSLELAAGLHLLHGWGSVGYVPLAAPETMTTAAYAATQLAGSLSAGARWVPPLRLGGGRVRLGVDVRRDLGATLHLAGAGRALTVAEWSVQVSAGLEWPTGWSPLGG